MGKGWNVKLVLKRARDYGQAPAPLAANREMQGYIWDARFPRCDVTGSRVFACV